MELDKPGKVLSFAAAKNPTTAECHAKARQLMFMADSAFGHERKAQLLLEAGDWLRRGRGIASDRPL